MVSKKVDDLYYLFREIITEKLRCVKGKICVPISGGLDSRLVAGFLGDRIDLVLVFGRPGAKHIEYAHRIARAAGYKKGIIVTTVDDSEINECKEIVKKINGLPEESTKSYCHLKHANEVVDLSQYTFVVPHMLDPYMGGNVNLLTLLKQKKTEQYWQDYEIDISNKGVLIWRFFGGYVNPIMDDRLKKFSETLPLRYKFHQYLYRQMFKKYFPDLAAIPRDNMNVRMDCNEVTYFIARTMRYFKKKIGKYEFY